jgi:hypothetical protein
MSGLHQHLSMSRFVFRPSSPFRTFCWQAILLLFCGLLTFGTSQSATAAGSTIYGPPPMHPFFTRFTQSVTYEQALRLITNLGLQPAFDCVTWQPMGQKESFAKEHRLLIAPAYLTAPDDWFVRLQHTAGIISVVEGFPISAGDNSPVPVPADRVYTCPSSGTLATLNANEAGTFAQISFAAPKTTYDQALFDISNIGLQLADPCYIRSSEQGYTPPWHPMEQAGSFAKNNRLIIQTNKGVTSSQWQNQLRALSDVTALATLTPPPWCWTPIQITLVVSGALGVAVLVAVFWVVKKRRARRSFAQ